MNIVQRSDMRRASIIVRADWDDEAQVWVATSDDIEGLALEAPSVEKLSENIAGAIADLVELNGGNFGEGDIPVYILAERRTLVPRPSSDRRDGD